MATLIWSTLRHKKEKKPSVADGTYSDVKTGETPHMEEWEYNGSIVQSRDRLVQPGAFFIREGKKGKRILVGTVLHVEPLDPLDPKTKRFRLFIRKTDRPVEANSKDELVRLLGFRHIRSNEYMYGMSEAVRTE